MSTYTTKWGSDKISVTANWSNASDQINGDLHGGYQVADFRHDGHAALRKALAQCASIEGMADDEAETLIEAAMAKAVES